MTKQPKPEPDESESVVQERFERTLGRLVNTPHKPHKPNGREPKPPPERSPPEDDTLYRFEGPDPAEREAAA